MNVDVVIVGGSANALGILRSLGPHIKCLVLASDEKSPVFKSRYGIKRLVKSTKSEHIIDQLLQLSNSFDRPPVLFLSEEKTVEQVSLHRAKLTPYYCFSFVSHALVIDLQSKIKFQQVAEQYESPIPKANFIQKQQDIDTVTGLAFPCVFKPVYQDATYAKSFKKAYKVNGLDEVSELYNKVKVVMPTMILQEWIHGNDSDIYFCLAYFDKNSQLMDAFTGRKLRSWPLNIGGTASCTNAPEAHKELTDITVNFAQLVGYQGLLGMEYKYDNQRKGYYMIEPTIGRTDYQHEIATLSGHNLLLQIYRHCRQESIPKYELQKKAVIWRDEIADANALANGGDPNEPKTKHSYGAIRRWQDPMPYLNNLYLRLKNRLITNEK